ncbi:alpha/beta fold hydrolase [Reichenbachiella sp.]|uniref:alpha/beta fold hydrolase n=1 Tax=Reichenbachiella sp. TaxID=2184521 RepID=UPI003BB1CCEB
MSQAQTPTQTAGLELNDVSIYYETYGQGEPLLLLHGYTQSSKSWKDFVEYYAQDYKVYLIDLRGHGKSSPFTETFKVEDATKDILALIQTLKLEKIKGIGFSFGGDVLLQLSSMSPETVESMVVIGSNADWDAQNYPDMLEAFTYENIEQFAWIRDFHAGGEEQVQSVIEQLANYNIKMSADELARIKANTLLILGDREQISVESVVSLSKKIDNSALWIMPNTGHYAHQGDNREEFIRISKKFLAQKNE